MPADTKRRLMSGPGKEVVEIGRGGADGFFDRVGDRHGGAHDARDFLSFFFVLLLYAARDAGEEVLRWPVVQVTI